MSCQTASKNNIKLAAGVVILLFLSSIIVPVLSSNQSEQIETVSRSIFLFRHAEKQKNQGKNPHLTAKGKKRAINIANQLADKNISFIYSSNYLRTQETATPLANKLNITLQNYNPRELENFAKHLLKLKGNIAIAGHSNTTPQLIKLLGGDPDIYINEDQYNDLFQLVTKGDQVDTIRLKTTAD